MKIIVAGCGRVGYEIAEQLIKENNEITVIDTNYKILDEVSSECDVIGYHGDCTSFETLKTAGVEDTDLLIATTDQDEKNMLACLIAKKVGNCQTIARVRSPQYSKEIVYLKEELGLSMSINPEYAVADEMVRLIKIPSAFEVDTFYKGLINLVSFSIPENSPLNNVAIKDARAKLGSNVLICVVRRGDEITIPGGDFVLKSNDMVSLALSLADVNMVYNAFGIKTKKIKNVLIAGGGTISYYLAIKLIETGIKVKIIEKSRERCEELAELIPGAVIINGDATDKSLLEEESIDKMDAVCSIMNSDEENILLSLYISNMSDVKVMTKIHRNSYEDIAKTLPIGHVISTKKITAEYIIRYVRSMKNAFNNNVEALYRMMDDRVEALEFVVKDDKKFEGKPLKDLQIKSNTLVCSIYRKNRIIRPGGNDYIKKGDNVVVVTTNTGLNDIEDILE